MRDTVRDETISHLKQLGMTAYEAKAYVALLAAGEPCNGYEVAKISGVPRSMVYESLGKLVERGAAFEVVLVDGGKTYVALPAPSLLDRLRRDFDRKIDVLEEMLPQVAGPVATSLMHHLSGASAVMQRACDLVENAKSDLFLSLWEEENNTLAPFLRRAAARDVELCVMQFGGELLDVGHVSAHLFTEPEMVLARVGCRLLVIVVDQREVLIAGALPGESWGVYSDDPAVVLLSVEFIRHDIALQTLVERVGSEKVAALWDADPVLMRLATGLVAPHLDRHRRPSGETTR